MSEWAFIDHITRYMQRTRLGDKRPPTLWPSEASAVATNEYGEVGPVGKCRRATFFRYLVDNYQFDPTQYAHWEPLISKLRSEMLPIEPYLLWIWRAGDLYEEHCVQLAKDSGIFVEAQVPIYIKELNISGKIDIVVIDPDSGKLSVVEVKSVYSLNADKVMGKPADRRKGLLGTPRDSNLMQIALYQWHLASENEEFDDGRLVYGARDTGRYAEYKIKTGDDETISYRGISPIAVKAIQSPITIDSILEQYRYIQTCLDTGVVPPRDFDIQFSDEKILNIYKQGMLNKAETERVARREEQIKEGKLKINKQIEKGDHHCHNCQFRTICYDRDNNPREV